MICLLIRTDMGKLKSATPIQSGGPVQITPCMTVFVISYFAMLALLHLLQELLRIKILNNATVQPFFEVRA